MNIIKSGTSQVSYLFNEKLLPALSAQHQKLGTIKTVALLALAGLAGYLLYRACWTKKIKSVTDGMTLEAIKKRFDNLMITGHKQVEQKEYENALLVYNEALKLYPQNHELYLQALFFKIDVLSLSGKEQAIKECDQALALYPQPNMIHWFILLKKASILNEFNRKDEAKGIYNEIRTKCLAEAIPGAPNQKQALILLAEANLQLENYQEAAAMGKNLIALEPDNVEWVFSTIDCLEKDKKYKQALAIYEKAVVRHPKNIFLLKGHADCLYRLKRFEKAIEKYEELLKNPLLGGDDEEDEDAKGEVQKEYEVVLSVYADSLKESNKAEAANVYDKLAGLCVSNKYMAGRYKRLANELRSALPASSLTDEQLLETVSARLYSKLTKTDSQDLRKAREDLQKVSTLSIKGEKDLLREFTLKLSPEEAAELKALIGEGDVE